MTAPLTPEAAERPRYAHLSNTVIDTNTDRQVVVLLPSNCTQRRAVALAKLLADAMNKETP